MFTITIIHSPPDPFIRHSESGFVTRAPSLCVCLTEFDTNHYRDALFAKFSVPFPDMLQYAVIKRRAEYLSGRYAAHTLLQENNCQASVVPGPDRDPEWPMGWRGSISHTCRHAIAVIAPQSAGLVPGVDIEQLCPTTMLETADIFTSSPEKKLLSACDMEYETALLITFSAKESLYKAVYPQVRHFLGFDTSVICELDPRLQRFSLRLTQPIAPSLPAGYRFSGHYKFHSDNVITLIA